MNRTGIFCGVGVPSVCACFELWIMRDNIDISWFKVILGTLLLVEVLVYKDTCQKMFTSGIYWWKVDEDLEILESADKDFAHLMIVYLIIGLLFCIAMVYIHKPFFIILPAIKLLLMVSWGKQLKSFVHGG